MGTKDKLHRIRLAGCLLVAVGGTAACVYDYPDPAAPSPAVSTPDRTPATGDPSGVNSLRPYSDPQILEREARNYAELYVFLRAAPAPSLLFEVGPLDGPVRGFGTTAGVPETGLYTVTAACVGAPGAKVSVGQEHPGAPFRPMELALDCTGVTSQVFELEQGYVFAHLVLPTAGDTPWTGAVGGVRVASWAGA